MTMETVLTGNYFFITFTPGGGERPGVANAILTDDDLIRGNTEGEGVAFDARSDPPVSLIDAEDREVSVTVVFNDGTTLDDVLGQTARSSFPSGFTATERYLLDQSALEAVGKSYADIVAITHVETVDHDLSYADFGFEEETRDVFDPTNRTPSGVLDQYTFLASDGVLDVDAADGVLANDMDFEGDTLTAEIQLNPVNGTVVFNADGSFVYTPNDGFVGTDQFIYNVTDGNSVEDGFVNITVVETLPPQFDVLPGTGGNDRLTGTEARDVIDGNAGNLDILTGNGGEDVFLFGLNVGSSGLNRDIVTDFDPDEDTLVLEFGVEIASAVERNGNLIVRFEGEGDVALFLNADLGILDDALFLEGGFDPLTFFTA